MHLQTHLHEHVSAYLGQQGFGYDPLFVPDGYTESFARLGGTIKNQLSHRGAALSQVVAWLANHS